jgi:tricarballylate dehydrogenase
MSAAAPVAEERLAALSRPHDVLVVGGGHAAMCAAITASEAGATVLVVEHAPKDMRGGNTRHTRNLRYMHRAPTAFMTGPYLEEPFVDDLMRVTGGETDETLARLTIHESEALVEWMEDHGIRFQPSLGGTLQLSATNIFFLGGGKALLNTHYANAAVLGIDVVYDCEVTDLLIEYGRFRAAQAVVGGEELTLTADAVIVASGGFEANIDWLREYWGEAADNFIIRGTPYNQGRLLRVLMDRGAKSVGDPTQCHAIALDARAPKFDGGIATRLDSVSLGIVVNRDGERFYDEGEDFWPKRYAIWGRLVAQQPGQVAYSIVDSRSADSFMPSLYPPIKADTLPALAAELGLDTNRLTETVGAFNEATQPGEFDITALDGLSTQGLNIPKTNWAQPIDTPPYYAWPLKPGITFTYLGVAVNERAQVLCENGSPFDNVYAAGEIMAGNVLGKGYLAGIGMTIGGVFGRIAGGEAARHVRG